MPNHTDEYWKKELERAEQNVRNYGLQRGSGFYQVPAYFGMVKNLEVCLQKEFEEKLEQAKLETAQELQTSMKSYSFDQVNIQKQFAQQQEKIEQINSTLVIVQHENKSLRDELQSLRATLVEVLDALTANASGSPKDGPSANSSSEQSAPQHGPPKSPIDCDS